MNRFIAGGAGEYSKALQQEYDSARKSLDARLAECFDPVEQQTLKNELEDLKRDFERRLCASRHSLFGIQ